MLYVLLAVRGSLPEPGVPATIGLTLFALIHGGAVSVEVPPNPSLLGLGGSLRIGLPATSFVLLPFLSSLLGHATSRVGCARRSCSFWWQPLPTP